MSNIDMRDLEAALVELIEASGPYGVNVHVPNQEHVLPMIPSGLSVKDLIKA
jgi:acetolactate synthase I/II/III large subunit